MNAHRKRNISCSQHAKISSQGPCPGTAGGTLGVKQKCLSVVKGLRAVNLEWAWLLNLVPSRYGILEPDTCSMAERGGGLSPMTCFSASAFFVGIATVSASLVDPKQYTQNYAF